MLVQEFAAGAGQSIVVYVSDDDGGEVDPVEIYRYVPTNSARRAQHGVRIVAMSSFPLRHAQAWMAREGSGYQSKIAVAVVYAVP